MRTVYYRGVGLVNTIDNWWTAHAQRTDACHPKLWGKGYLFSHKGTLAEAKQQVDTTIEVAEWTTPS